MLWAEPSHGAAVHALTQVHASLSYYQSHAHTIRSHAINLLSPYATGSIMLQRLRKISFCLCQIYESFPQTYSFFSSSTCHHTTKSQNLLIQDSIYKDIRLHSDLLNITTSSSTTTSSSFPFSSIGDEKTTTTDLSSNMILINYCHRYILGRRILTEKYKRLK